MENRKYYVVSPDSPVMTSIEKCIAQLRESRDGSSDGRDVRDGFMGMFLWSVPKFSYWAEDEKKVYLAVPEKIGDQWTLSIHRDFPNDPDGCSRIGVDEFLQMRASQGAQLRARDGAVGPDVTHKHEFGESNTGICLSCGMQFPVVYGAPPADWDLLEADLKARGRSITPTTRTEHKTL